MKVAVKVRLKPSILDPQGKAVHHALTHLGFSQFSDVRIGKFIELTIDSVASPEEATRIARAAAGQLLANPVIEDFEVEYEEE